MSETTQLRISLYLFHFFNDKRQQSRIFINEEVKNIKDLQNFIKDSFGIKREIYLLCQNYYLPPDQDVRILNYDDAVHVIPTNSEAENLIIDVPKKKRRKHSEEKLSSILETPSEPSASKIKNKHKIKDKHVDVIPPTPSKSLEKLKKRKRKKSSSDEEQEVDNNKEKRKTDKAIKIISNEIVTKTVSIPSPTKSYKLNEKICFDTLKSKKVTENKEFNPNKTSDLQRTSNNELNKRSTCKNISALSNNSVNKSKNASQSSPKIGSWLDIETSSLNELNCNTSTETIVPLRCSTNISNISTQKNQTNTSIRNSKVTDNHQNGTKNLGLSKTKWDTFLTAEENSCNSNNNSTLSVKKNTFTTNDSNNLGISNTQIASWDDSSFLAPTCPTTNDLPNLELSTTKIDSFIDNSILTTHSKNNSTNRSKTYRSSCIDDSQSSEYAKTRQSSYSDEEIPQRGSISSSNNESTANASCFESDNSIQNKSTSTIPNTEQKSKHKILKEMNSISHIINRLSQEKTDTSFNLSDDNITTRRRIRTRKRTRKSKPTSDSPEIAKQQPEKPKFYEPRIIIAPKIHKRFSDNELSDNFDSPDLSKINEPFFSHSTPYSLNTKHHPDMSVIQEEYHSETLKNMHMEAKKLLSEPGNVNDKIIFKKLKLDEEYTPIESDYIFAEINFISDDKKNLELKIIAGHQELKEPKGRFSILEDEEQDLDETDASMAYLEWNELIQPKLIET